MSAQIATTLIPAAAIHPHRGKDGRGVIAPGGGALGEEVDGEGPTAGQFPMAGYGALGSADVGVLVGEGGGSSIPHTPQNSWFL